jgi:hypothetical protein
MPKMERFANTQLALPPPATLYLAVKVVLPGLRPSRTDDALERSWAVPAWITAFASTAAVPPTAKDMKHDVEMALPSAAVVTDTRTFPEAGTVTMIVGPGVARSA